MPERKAFLLRLDPRLLTALQHWADDELRSMNGQMEFLLRKALKDAKRQVPPGPSNEDDSAKA